MIEEAEAKRQGHGRDVTERSLLMSVVRPKRRSVVAKRAMERRSDGERRQRIVVAFILLPPADNFASNRTAKI